MVARVSFKGSCGGILKQHLWASVPSLSASCVFGGHGASLSPEPALTSLGALAGPLPPACPGLCPHLVGAEPLTASARAPGVIGAPCPTGLLGSRGGMKLGITLHREPHGEPPGPWLPALPLPTPFPPAPQFISAMHLTLGVLVFYFL